MGQEALDCSGVASTRGQVQRTIPVVVGDVGVGAAGEQEADGIVLALA